MIRRTLLTTFGLLFLLVGQTEAITSQNLQTLDTDSLFYAGQGQSSCPTGTVAPGTNISTTAGQSSNAATIIGIAKTDNISESGALIGIAVGIAESSLTNLANENVPLSEQNPNKQGDGSNGDSLGVFQQQIDANWSTISSNVNDVNAINQLMTPAYSAEAFFGGGGPNASSALQKGLLNVPNWEALSPWVAAQDVQASAYNGIPSQYNNESSVVGGNYQAVLNQGLAQHLLSQLWGSSPAIALPVPLTGVVSIGAGGGATGCTTTTTSSSTYENPLRSVNGLEPERIDQGVEYAGAGPVYAIGDGTVENLVNSGWNFGGYDAFLSYQLTSGPAQGDYVYVAEDCVPQVTIGQQVTSSTVICNITNPNSTGIETGWAQPPGDGLALANSEFNGSNSTAYGINFSQLLVSLGAPGGVLQNDGPPGPLPSTWPQW